MFWKYSLAATVRRDGGGGEENSSGLELETLPTNDPSSFLPKFCERPPTWQKCNEPESFELCGNQLARKLKGSRE